MCMFASHIVVFASHVVLWGIALERVLTVRESLQVARVTAGIEGFEWYENNTIVSPLAFFQLWLPTVNATYPTEKKEFYDVSLFLLFLCSVLFGWVDVVADCH